MRQMLKLRNQIYLFLTMAFLLPNMLSSQCNVTAYVGQDAGGGQPYSEILALRFTVNSPITVTQLGAYDSNQDGLLATIQVAIVKADGTVVAGPISMSGTADPLVGMFRMSIISPVLLPPGQYFIETLGYDNLEMNGNVNAGDSPVTTNDGGGLLTFDGFGYQGTSFGVPAVIDNGNPAIFHAGTFIYSSATPQLTANVNGIVLTADNDGNSEIALLDVCNTTADNLFFSGFAELAGVGTTSSVKIEQQFVRTNTLFAPVDGINPLSAFTTAFNRNVSLVNPTLSGSLIMRFRAFLDSNANNVIDGNECAGDWLEYNVTVNDFIAPTITCPGDVTVDSDGGADGLAGDCGAVVDSLTPLAFRDNCPNPTVTYVLAGATMGTGSNDASGTLFGFGTTSVIYTITDNGVPANTATCTVHVTVIDVEAPVIVCPVAITVSNDLDSCNAVVDYEMPMITDLCIDSEGSQAINQLIVNDAVDCPGSPSKHLRYFTNTSATPVEITEVNFAIFRSGLGQTITINIYEKTPADPFLYANLNLLATTDVVVAPGLDSVLLTAMISATIPVGKDYVLEISEVADISFVIGYNVSGEIEPTYFVSDGCATPEPTDLALFLGDQTALILYSDATQPATLVQTAGLPSGSIFPIGITTNTFEASDAAGNTASCSFTVTVEDDQDPDITCPANITTQLDPLECEAIAEFDATVTDNCPGVVYEVTSDLESGDSFPAGTTQVVYEATDAAGNTATCSFNVVIVDYSNSSLGCINRNVSLDENCSALIDPFMVLTGYLDINGDTLLGCLDSFKIDVKNTLGNSIGDVVTGAYLGKVLNYTISNPSHGFYCWGTIKVEDKFPPTIVCTNDTITCVEPLSNAKLPLGLDNCGATLVLLDNFYTPLNCDANFLGYHTRTYKAKDKYGNESLPCTQLVYVERTKLNTLLFPPSRTGVTAVECGSFIPDDKGNPSIAITGVPSLNGIPLVPGSHPAICNGFVVYSDELTINTPCKKMITRKWEVGEWWCNNTNIQTYAQIIEISDNTAPVIAPLADMTISTGSNSCTGIANLPAAKITDNCNALTVKINTGEGVLNTNGGLASLTAGGHAVTYTATDACGKQSSRTFRVLVVDKAEPIAVCVTNTVVSLKDDGTAWLDKSSVDNGSFDECGNVDLKIRRMTTTCDTTSTLWVDQVGFCCSDLGAPVMVALLVTDQSGQSNQCMVSVQVQDKRIPSMVCPAGRNVLCTTAYDEHDLGASFGKATLIGGGCANSSTITEVLSGDLNDCRLGALVRTFTLKFNNVVIQTCTQELEFVPVVPFDGSKIKWPKDTTLVNGMCSIFDLDADNLPAGYGKPNVSAEGVCDLVAASSKDDVYNFTSNGACYKIVRHWTVINWCKRNTDGTFWQESRDQVLVVMNTIPPVITSPTTKKEECSYSVNCDPAPIELKATATDVCTPENELAWTYKITFENGSTKNGVGNNASGTYAVGKHRVDFTVRDKCGNESYTGYDFEVKNCKAPTAYCKQGLSTALQGMDTNGDGVADAEMAMITPEMFDNGSSHTCGYDLTLSFSANVNNDTMVLSCGNIGRVNIEMWVTDQNGNTSFCKTFIDVIDSNNVHICANLPSNIAGRVTTSDDREIANAVIHLEEAGEDHLLVTGGDGKYGFMDMTNGGDYKLSATKDGDDINGISTLDLVLIQRHILGIAKITDPYLLIAADVNHDNKITATDLVELRKLILGISGDLPNNTSWRFVEKSFAFPSPSNPWTTNFPEFYNINALNGSMNVDFIGLKVGDVNGNVNTNVAGDKGSENRSRNVMSLTGENKKVNKGDKITLDIKVDNNEMLSGLQLAMKMTGLKVTEVVSAKLTIMDNQYHIDGNELNLSYHNDRAIQLGNEVLFTLVLEAEQSGDLSDMITLTDGKLSSEAYVGRELEEVNLQLDWRNSSKEVFTVMQNEPNPWTSNTSIAVTLPEAGKVSLSVKDMTGKLLYSQQTYLPAGKNHLTLNKQLLPVSGVLVYEVEHAGAVIMKKMILID